MAVGILILAAALFPVIDQATTTEKTFTNTGAYFMTDDPTDYTLEYKGTLGEIWVNGELVTTTTELPASGWTLISTPDVFIRLQNFSAQSYNVWLFTMSGGNSVIGNNTNESVIVTATANTIQVGTNEPISYDGEFRGIAKTGDYVMTVSGGFVVSDTDTIIVGNGTTVVTHWYDMFYMIGTVNDMDVESNPSITVSDVAVNKTAMSGYVNGSQVTSVTFTATDGENTADATYDRVIVPTKVTLELAVHASQDEIELLETIPVLITVGLIMGIVGVIAARRFE